MGTGKNGQHQWSESLHQVSPSTVSEANYSREGITKQDAKEEGTGPMSIGMQHHGKAEDEVVAGGRQARALPAARRRVCRQMAEMEAAKLVVPMDV